MHIKLTRKLALVSLLPLALGNMGVACSPNGLFPVIGTDSGNDTAIIVDDTVDLVFVNETPFDVDAIVNGSYFATVTGNDLRPTEPVSVDCADGDTLFFSGDLVAAEGTFPSPDNLVFHEGPGLQYLCGDTIEVHYFQDADGVLRLDGGATGP